jgi:hypothetical protein
VVWLTVFSSVLGRFAPGFKEMGDAFGDMWRYASKNKEKSGCESQFVFFQEFHDLR